MLAYTIINVIAKALSALRGAVFIGYFGITSDLGILLLITNIAGYSLTLGTVFDQLISKLQIYTITWVFYWRIQMLFLTAVAITFTLLYIFFVGGETTLFVLVFISTITFFMYCGLLIWMRLKLLNIDVSIGNLVSSCVFFVVFFLVKDLGVNAIPISFSFANFLGTIYLLLRVRNHTEPLPGIKAESPPRSILFSLTLSTGIVLMAYTTLTMMDRLLINQIFDELQVTVVLTGYTLIYLIKGAFNFDQYYSRYMTGEEYKYKILNKYIKIMSLIIGIYIIGMDYFTYFLSLYFSKFSPLKDELLLLQIQSLNLLFFSFATTFIRAENFDRTMQVKLALYTFGIAILYCGAVMYFQPGSSLQKAIFLIFPAGAFSLMISAVLHKMSIFGIALKHAMFLLILIFLNQVWNTSDIANISMLALFVFLLISIMRAGLINENKI